MGAIAPAQIGPALARALDLARRLVDRPRTTAIEEVRKILRSVEYQRNRLLVTFSGRGLGAVVGLTLQSGDVAWPSNEAANATDFAITVPLQTSRCWPQMKLVVSGHGPGVKLDPSLVTAIVRAWRGLRP